MANITIHGLNETNSLSSTDEFPVYQDNTTKKINYQNLKNKIKADLETSDIEQRVSQLESNAIIDAVSPNPQIVPVENITLNSSPQIIPVVEEVFKGVDNKIHYSLTNYSVNIPNNLVTTDNIVSTSTNGILTSVQYINLTSSINNNISELNQLPLESHPLSFGETFTVTQDISRPATKTLAKQKISLTLPSTSGLASSLVAATNRNGLMSSADKVKLDNMTAFSLVRRRYTLGSSNGIIQLSPGLTKIPANGLFRANLTPSSNTTYYTELLTEGLMVRPLAISAYQLGPLNSSGNSLSLKYITVKVNNEEDTIMGIVNSSNSTVTLNNTQIALQVLCMEYS